MKRIRLLVIDPQNDFMDVDGAALPVPGASADMARLAGFVDTMAAQIDDIVVTLDSHASVGIERTSFWLDGQGAPVAPSHRSRRPNWRPANTARVTRAAPTRRWLI